MSRLKNPLLTVLAIYGLCFLFRCIEYFVLRTDQTFWGEAFLHKLVGILILCIIIKYLSCNVAYIGFCKNEVLKHICMGLLFGLAVFTIAYSLEIFLVVVQGSFQSVEVYVSRYAVVGNVGKQTAVLFFIICIVGNMINVVMEEGIFRGLFQKMLEQKYKFIASAIFASCLFGVWHIVGPIRNYYDGVSSIEGTMANIIMLVITSGLIGFKCALLTKLTGSLYMAMGDHFINNTIVNILHVTSLTGADEFMFVRITIAQTLSFLLVLIFYLLRQQRLKNRFID